MAVLVVVATALIGRLAPEWVGIQGKPGAGYMAVNLGYTFLAAAAGGFVAAWAGSGFPPNHAPNNPLRYVLVLAIAVLALAALSAVQARGRQPLGYQLALVALTPLGVVVGGLVRLRLWGYF